MSLNNIKLTLLGFVSGLLAYFTVLIFLQTSSLLYRQGIQVPFFTIIDHLIDPTAIAVFFVGIISFYLVHKQLLKKITIKTLIWLLFIIISFITLWFIEGVIYPSLPVPRSTDIDFFLTCLLTYLQFSSVLFVFQFLFMRTSYKSILMISLIGILVIAASWENWFNNLVSMKVIFWPAGMGFAIGRILDRKK